MLVTLFTAALVLILPQSTPQDGFMLFTPMPSSDSYLLDVNQNVMHTLHDQAQSGLASYLLESGNLLRTYQIRGQGAGTLSGSGGGVHELDWNSQVVWDYKLATANEQLHHDVALMPNGHVLMLARKNETDVKALAKGRKSGTLPPGAFWSERVLELDPTTGTIVWGWQLWDHLVQHEDIALPDFAVIDHSTTTTTAEANTSAGGINGKGGDLLYRWSNPKAYNRGTAADRKLFGQHDVQRIPEGRPGAGNFLSFNNGNGRPAGAWSWVDEFTPPTDANGNYSQVAGRPYDPVNLTWTYSGSGPNQFYADHVSGVERQANGNTLICHGPVGYVFEIDSADQSVWDCTNTHPSIGANKIFKVRRYQHWLWPGSDFLSVATSGTVDFHLRGGSANAGSATATLVSLGPLSSSSVGRTLHFVFVLGNSGSGVTSFVSNPVSVELTS